MREETAQPMVERLVDIDDQMVDAGPFQLAIDRVLIDPMIFASRDKSMSGLGFTGEQESGSRQATFGLIAHLQGHTVVLLSQQA